MSAEVRLIGLDGVPEVRPGDDLAALVGDAVERGGEGLSPGDVLVVTHKVVSKAEGRLVDLRRVEPSPFAAAFAVEFGKDPRQVEVVLRESRRIVKMDRGVLICETPHGFVCANAGVDASNVDAETVCLLPVDPTPRRRGSARRWRPDSAWPRRTRPGWWSRTPGAARGGPASSISRSASPASPRCSTTGGSTTPPATNST
jgi:coenzyme F420-0:L-glutamate ligase / coenzyme F420-1:gamma-L-glutamate ligase